MSETEASEQLGATYQLVHEGVQTLLMPRGQFDEVGRFCSEQVVSSSFPLPTSVRDSPLLAPLAVAIRSSRKLCKSPNLAARLEALATL